MFGRPCRNVYRKLPLNRRSTLGGYRKAWQKPLADAGISGKRMHDWRATFASRANAAHASSLALAHLLGHSSTTVLPTYTKPLDEHTRSVIQSLDTAPFCQNRPLGNPVSVDDILLGSAFLAPSSHSGRADRKANCASQLRT